MQGHVTILGFTPNIEAMIASGGRISTMDGTADEIRAKSLAAGKEKNEKLIGKVLSCPRGTRPFWNTATSIWRSRTCRCLPSSF